MGLNNSGTNVYFNNFNNSQEQILWEDLVIESISIYGQDMYYLPRELVSYDKIYGEDDISKYNDAIPIELYIKSVDGFEGDGVFLSKFGLEIRDQVTFTVARRIFEEEVTNRNQQLRPNEGDLIYFPLNKKLFQIKFVNHKPFFYQLGSLQTYDLTCELFEYSHEEISTGITEIDQITDFSSNLLDYALKSESGETIVSEGDDIIVQENYDIETIEQVADNNTIQNEQNTNDVIDWTELDPFSQSQY